jgi:hypothetical protein
MHTTRSPLYRDLVILAICNLQELATGGIASPHTFQLEVRCSPKRAGIGYRSDCDNVRGCEQPFDRDGVPV